MSPRHPATSGATRLSGGPAGAAAWVPLLVARVGRAREARPERLRVVLDRVAFAGEGLADLGRRRLPRLQAPQAMAVLDQLARHLLQPRLRVLRIGVGTELLRRRRAVDRLSE